jgi:hypothetical protein
LAPGYAKTFNVIELERLLQARSGLYDAGAYHFSVFGTPGAKPWGWRFEGHHLSLNFTIAGERFVATTPSFFGANPAQVGTGANKGLRTLKDEEDVARQLLLALNDQQRAAAIVDTRSYAQIISGTAAKVDPLPAAGISASALDAQQRALLTQLLAVHANTLRPELAQLRLARIESAGIDKVRFAWSGGIASGQAHYYRLQGPSFLLEYDNSQNNANHIHTVWRDFDGDFGRDLLREHHAGHAHGQQLILPGR